MNRHFAAATIIVCTIILPGMMAHLFIGDKVSLLEMGPMRASLWALGTITCGVVGVAGALTVANNGDSDDLDN